MKFLLPSSLLIAIMAISGCSDTQSVSSPPIRNVTWDSTPDPVKLVTNSLFEMYREELNPNDIQIKQTWTEDKKIMYQIHANGKFHSKSKQTANELSFSVLSNGSKVWGLEAKDQAEKLVWQQNDFVVKQQQLDFQGQSAHWKGEYIVFDAMVWTKDLQEFGDWESHQYDLTYINQNQVDHLTHLIQYSIDTGNGGWGRRVSITLDKMNIESGVGSGATSENATIKTTVTMNAQTEAFTLHLKSKTTY